MQHVKEYLLSKYKEHPLLYSFILIFLFLLKDFAIEVHHKNIAPLATETLNIIQQYFSALQEWLEALHLFNGYSLVISISTAALIIGAISISLRRTQQEALRLKSENEQSKAQYESDIIQGIRWRWKKGTTNQDIKNLQGFCPDSTCDGELDIVPYTKELPARLFITCSHCGEPIAERDYNYFTEDFHKAKRNFHEEIKREIRRRKRLKSSETHSDAIS